MCTPSLLCVGSRLQAHPRGRGRVPRVHSYMAGPFSRGGLGCGGGPPSPRPHRSGTLWLPRFPLFPFGPGPAHLEAGSAAAWERFHQLGPRNAELFNLSIPRCTEAPGCLGPAAFGTAALDKQRAAPALPLRPQLQPGLGTGGRRRLAKESSFLWDQVDVGALNSQVEERKLREATERSKEEAYGKSPRPEACQG